MFAICTLGYLLPQTILGISSSYIVGRLFVFAHVCDRFFNGARDASRNQLLNQAITEENKY
jgi:hypothetical protein